MPIFGVKSSFLKLVILAVQKRELIIEEVHIFKACGEFLRYATVKLPRISALLPVSLNLPDNDNSEASDLSPPVKSPCSPLCVRLL